MSPNSFKNLSLNEKQHLINENGTFAGNRKYYNHNINLFAIYNFFVEVHYSPTDNIIESISIIDYESTIKAYNNRIKIKF